MNRRSFWGVGLALAAALSLPVAVFAGPFAVRRTALETLTPAQVIAVQKQAMLHPAIKTINVPRNGRLVIWTGPDNDMLSYRVDGMRNPTLVVQPGATLDVLFINTDDDMLHNWRVGTWRATWPANAAPLVAASVGTPSLPHKTDTAYHAEHLTLAAPTRPGKYAYFCTVRGHAPGGMWGTLIVR